jgi:hypothetical protein
MMTQSRRPLIPQEQLRVEAAKDNAEPWAAAEHDEDAGAAQLPDRQ